MKTPALPLPPPLRYETEGGKSRCPGCVEGWATSYHNHMDGRGRIRLHTRDFFPEGETDFDTEYLACSEQSWFSRHRVYVALALVVIVIVTMIGALMSGI